MITAYYGIIKFFFNKILKSPEKKWFIFLPEVKTDGAWIFQMAVSSIIWPTSNRYKWHQILLSIWYPADFLCKRQSMRIDNATKRYTKMFAAVLKLKKWKNVYRSKYRCNLCKISTEHMIKIFQESTLKALYNLRPLYN